MADFSFLKNEQTKKWIISAPRRSHRTNINTAAPICPFCPGLEKLDGELYRVGGTVGDTNWHIRVVPNKFPFTLHHEVIIHSPDHHKNFEELPFSQVALILQTYRQRFEANRGKGHVYLFHNRGRAAGESLPHPHTQLAMIPSLMKDEIPQLGTSKWQFDQGGLETEQFMLFCPETSAWPDEVWITPHKGGQVFGAITDDQITDLGFVFSRLLQLFDLRHGHEFPFNFYIYPGKNWYLRVIPRIKTLGGFELGTGIMVNTQNPKETESFIKEHFWKPDQEKIRGEHQAEYLKSV